MYLVSIPSGLYQVQGISHNVTRVYHAGFTHPLGRISEPVSSKTRCGRPTENGGFVDKVAKKHHSVCSVHHRRCRQPTVRSENRPMVCAISRVITSYKYSSRSLYVKISYQCKSINTGGGEMEFGRRPYVRTWYRARDNR